MKTTLSKGAESGVPPRVLFISKPCGLEFVRRPRKKPAKKMETPSGISGFATNKSSFGCTGAMLKLKFLYADFRSLLL